MIEIPADPSEPVSVLRQDAEHAHTLAATIDCEYLEEIVLDNGSNDRISLLVDEEGIRNDKRLNVRASLLYGGSPYGIRGSALLVQSRGEELVDLEGADNIASIFYAMARANLAHHTRIAF